MSDSTTHQKKSQAPANAVDADLMSKFEKDL